MKRTLKSSDKLRLKSEFERVRAQGRKLVTPMALLFAAPSPDGSTKCGVICGRKFDNRAVGRNRARRLLWESYRLIKRRILPCHLALIPRRDVADAKMQDVKAHLEKALSKARLLMEEEK